MSSKNKIFATGEYYHVYNRGNSKQIIFRDNKDKERFVQLLSIMNQQKRIKIDEFTFLDSFKNNDDPLVAIGAYVLMDNHFHLLVKEIVDEGTTKFMQKVCTAYVMYFNKKYKRTGGLFEGNFKSKHVDDDVYMRYLYAYIHLNPAKMIDENWKNKVQLKEKELIEHIRNYPFSSFHDYCGIKRFQNSVLNTREFPLYFESPKDFTESILKWLKFEAQLL